jgi:hypothetical protein
VGQFSTAVDMEDIEAFKNEHNDNQELESYTDGLEERMFWLDALDSLRRRLKAVNPLPTTENGGGK